MRSKLSLLSLLLVACSGSSASVDLFHPPPTPAEEPTTFVTQEEDAGSKQKGKPVEEDAGSVEAAAEAAAPNASDDASQPDSGGPDADAAPDSSPDADAAVARYGVRFDGAVGSRLAIPAPASLIGQASVTLEAYYRVDAHTGPRGLVFSSPNAYCAVPTDGPKVGQPHCCAHDPNASACVESGVTLNTGTFYHVAFVLESSTWSMYLDGQKQGSVASPYAAYPSFSTVVVYEHPGNHLMFGVQLTNEASCTAVLDEFRLSHSALYTANFTPPKHLDAAGAVVLLLDDGAGTTSSGAKLTGSSWVSVSR